MVTVFKDLLIYNNMICEYKIQFGICLEKLSLHLLMEKFYCKFINDVVFMEIDLLP